MADLSQMSLRARMSTKANFTPSFYLFRIWTLARARSDKCDILRNAHMTDRPAPPPRSCCRYPRKNYRTVGTQPDTPGNAGEQRSS